MVSMLSVLTAGLIFCSITAQVTEGSALKVDSELWGFTLSKLLGKFIS